MDGPPSKMWSVRSRSQDASDKGACRPLGSGSRWRCRYCGMWKKTGRRLEEEEGKKRKRELRIETSERGLNQGMQLHVGGQLLDSVSLERARGADDERIGGRTKKMAFRAQASEPVVDEYLCLRGPRECGDHGGGREHR